MKKKHGMPKGMKSTGGGGTKPLPPSMMGTAMPPMGPPASIAGSDAMAPGETQSMPAPMPSASSPIGGGMGAGQMTPNAPTSFKRGGRVC